MKKKQENKAPQKSADKSSRTPNVDSRSGATDKSKAKSGRGTSNEGTNTSYDEER